MHFWKFSIKTGQIPLQDCENIQLKTLDTVTPSIWLKFNQDYFDRL